MKRVGLSRFRLGHGVLRSAAPATPLRPSLLEPQAFRIRRPDASAASAPPGPKSPSAAGETR